MARLLLLFVALLVVTPQALAADDALALALAQETEEVTLDVTNTSRATHEVAGMPAAVPTVDVEALRRRFDGGRRMFVAGRITGLVGAGVATVGTFFLVAAFLDALDGSGAASPGLFLGAALFLTTGGMAVVAGTVLGQIGWIRMSSAVRAGGGTLGRAVGWVSLGLASVALATVAASGPFPVFGEYLGATTAGLLLASYICAEVQAGLARRAWRDGPGASFAVRVTPVGLVGTF